MSGDPAIAAAAPARAEVLGPIFRVRPRDKRPLRRGWQAEASTDSASIGRLWQECPDANLGLLCGVRSWALDVDGAEGLDTLADLEDLNRWLPLGPASVTGSGGIHLFFAPSDRVRNSVRRLGAGLDSRGKGGFVVLPPSVHPCGNRYRWLPEREPWTCPLPEAPAWLLDLLDPPRPAHRPAVILPRARSGYAAVALRDELDRVARAEKTQRNNTLFKAAASLGRFVASGELSATNIGPALVGAAIATGLSRQEAEKTALSGLRTGARG